MQEREIWLACNRRALVVGSFVALLLAISLWLFAFSRIFEAPSLLRVVVGLIAAVATIVAALLWTQSRLPRLAYADRCLLVYTGAVAPYRVPIEIVEVFFRGQGKTAVQPRGHKAETKNLVVRLAERATEWHAREVRTPLGQWQDGYIAINGTWTEPISDQVVQQINRRLVEKKRELRAKEDSR